MTSEHRGRCGVVAISRLYPCAVNETPKAERRSGRRALQRPGVSTPLSLLARTQIG